MKASTAGDDVERLHLAEQLRAIRGSFILSLNDRPEVREIFAGFVIDAVETTYMVSGQAQRAGEVLISG